MAVQAIIPQSNVLAVDIRDTLNANGSSCTDEFISFFDSRAVINHWSFRKPYATDADMFKLTDAQIKSINCGFDITDAQINAYNLIPTKMDGGMNYWKYTKPSQMSKPMYRLGDFVGYFPKALPMVHDFYVPSTATLKDGAISASAFVRASSDGKSVSLADLGLLSSYHPAVLVRLSSNTSRYTAYASKKTLSDGVFNVDIPISAFMGTTGVWEVYPFVASSDTLSGATCYTIANLHMATINVKDSPYSIDLKAVRKTGEQAINYTITITNTSSAVNWTNNTWQIKANNVVTMSGNLPSPIAVNGNGTTTITGTISNIPDTSWNAPLLGFYIFLNSGNETEWAAIPSQNLELT